MSDTLRDRIAEAIWDALDAQRFVGFGPYVDRVNGVIDTEGSDGIDMAAVADAVIEALGLTRVTRSQNPPIHRWVTEWEPDS